MSVEPFGNDEIANGRPSYQIEGDISRLTEINGQAVTELERKMKPSGSDFDGVFLAEHDHLLDIMKQDDETVRSYGLTHEQVAAPLFDLSDAVAGKQGKVVVGGRTYKITDVSYWHGRQFSPIDTRMYSNIDVRVMDEETGDEEEFPMLLPYMISSVGFYEGHVPERRSPERIISFFKLAPSKK